jgi:hypothetical protein
LRQWVCGLCGEVEEAGSAVGDFIATWRAGRADVAMVC